MNRIEFIRELERLLGDLSKEERDDAIQYYQDYFEDAGKDKEEDIIKELGSPQKVANTIKAGVENRDDVFDVPKQEEKVKKPWTNKWLKLFLVIAIFVMAFPVVFPIMVTVVVVACAILFAGFIILASFVVVAIAITIAGGTSVLHGIVHLFRMMIAPAFVSIGMGLIMASLGLVATVFLVKACIIAFPAMFRGIVNLFRRFIHGKETSHE